MTQDRETRAVTLESLGRILELERRVDVLSQTVERERLQRLSEKTAKLDEEYGPPKTLIHQSESMSCPPAPPPSVSPAAETSSGEELPCVGATAKEWRDWLRGSTAGGAEGKRGLWLGSTEGHLVRVEGDSQGPPQLRIEVNGGEVLTLTLPILHADLIAQDLLRRCWMFAGHCADKETFSGEERCTAGGAEEFSAVARTLLVDLVRIDDALKSGQSLISNQGQSMDGFSALANFQSVAGDARKLLEGDLT